MAKREEFMKSIKPIRVNHINAVVEDFAESSAHFQRVYDAEILMDLPHKDWHAAVISVGGVLFEIFAPTDFFLHSRHGPHYFGVEYQADLDVAREVVAAHNIRIGRDIVGAIHTDPRDCLGMSFEFYKGEFTTLDYELLGGPMRPPQYWRDVHPLGITGLKGYTVLSLDNSASEKFLKEVLGADTVTEVDRPEIGARCLTLRVADAFVELLSATENGTLRQNLERLGPGIHSTVFGVKSIEHARAHFAKHGVELTPGTSKDRWSIAAECNRGLVFEFMEE